jgi:hypothetical protein
MFLLSLQVIEQIDVDDGNEESATRTDGEISLDELMIWLVKEKIWVEPDTVAGRFHKAVLGSMVVSMAGSTSVRSKIMDLEPGPDIDDVDVNVDEL